jgi:uncharacterized protein
VRATASPVIDCDVHVAVPSAAALIPYLPAHWAEFASISLREPKALSFTYPDRIPMVATRAADVTLDAIRRDVLSDAALALIHCYYAVESYTHPYLAPALATAVNRWIEDVWLAREDRLLASAVVTPQHPAAAAEEVERIAANPRFVGVLVPARVGAGYGDQRYWPIWDAAAANDLPVVISYGGASGLPPTPTNWPATFFETYTSATVAFQSHVTSIVMSGILERVPGLRFVVMESGWTWLPALCWRMEEARRAFRSEVPWVSRPFAEYVEQHFRFTTGPTDAPPDPRHLADLFDEVHARDVLMFGSDYPHRYDAPAAELLAGLSPPDRDRVLWHNASSWFALDARALPSAVPAGSGG